LYLYDDLQAVRRDQVSPGDPLGDLETRLTTWVRRAVVLALGLALLVAACGGNDQNTSATRIETQAAGSNTPAGFTVRLVRDQGFSIALPKDWESIAAHEALNSEAMQKFRRANPEVNAELQALAQPNSPIKLLAIGPEGEGGFLTNLNVLVTPIPADITYEQWSSSELAQLKKVPTIKGMTQEEIALPAGRGLHVSYRATFNRQGGRFTAFIDQYLVKKGSSLYVVTFTTTPRLRARLSPTFSKAARTFRLTG
jgi:hypothetical protein